MRSAFKAALQQETDFRSKLQFPLMTQTLPKTEMPQAKQPQVAFHKNHPVVPCNSGAAKKRHISYGRRDDYILEIEQQLMDKYRVGYSGLHKMLVIKEGNQQFSRPFV